MNVSITGASGYIGRSLVQILLDQNSSSVTVLSRSKELTDLGGANFRQIEGDLLTATSLTSFLTAGCTVVSLAYLRHDGSSANYLAIKNLIDCCKTAGVKRLVHVSTADVSGRVGGDLIDESMPCNPIDDYGITKLTIEHQLRAEIGCSFDFVILRPTAVFGPGSSSLSMLTQKIISGNRLENYLKSCLLGRRRMNLVSVSNVVAAIEFLMMRESNFNGEVYIVSDDECYANNYLDVEKFLMSQLGGGEYVIPRVILPLDLLKGALWLMRRNCTNPRRNYASSKLQNLGFVRHETFENALSEYASWCRSSMLN